MIKAFTNKKKNLESSYEEERKTKKRVERRGADRDESKSALKKGENGPIIPSNRVISDKTCHESDWTSHESDRTSF